MDFHIDLRKIAYEQDSTLEYYESPEFEKDQEAANRLTKSTFPQLCKQVEWSKVPESSAKEKIKDYFDDLYNNLRIGKSLYIWGPFGTGKTSLACIIAKQAFKLVYGVEFVMAMEIPNLYIQNPWLIPEERSWKDVLVGSKFLVIDDFVKTDNKGENWVELVLKKRVHDRRSTVITSNVSIEELEGTSVKSLLSEAFVPVHVNNKNWRKEMALKDARS